MPIDKKQIARTSARILLDTKSVVINAVEPFILASGRASPVYTDCRRLISFPEERGILMDYATSIIREDIGAVDYVAGGGTAGIPYAAFIADRMNKPMLYLHNKPENSGRMAHIEGVMDEKGKHAVLVGDIQSDGSSKKDFVGALRNAGAMVRHALVILHYGIFPASEENMRNANITLHALTTLHDILAVAREDGLYDTATLDIVENFLATPDTWSIENSRKIREGSTL